MIKLVILDVDGTITDQNRLISTKAIEAIRTAEQNGVVVSLISGNVIPVMYALKIFLGINGPVFAENGGVEFNTDITPFFTMDEPKRFYRKLLELNLCEGILTNTWRYCSVGYFPKEEKVEEIYELSKDYNVELTDSSFSWHILNKGQNKGYAIRKLIEKFSMSPDNILACGDSLNDMPMFSLPVKKAVPKNAKQELKSLADYISAKDHGDSIADILSRIDSF
ncbi:MAG: phosphoglycolate phosphatase [Thermoplasmatales archaeon]|nr:phosphoglycolate phosphatase [Thermoplasmatales archaeon]MCW6170520.1 phosphoglycolate phosphatase [Thermoplasmatales archaeon]